MAEDKPIFILEDDVLIALDIKETLEEAGHRNFVLCHSLRQAEVFLAERTPRLAFLDVNLGRGETSLAIGVELAARDCAIILMSGYSGATVDLPPEIDAVPRLSKPFVTSDLLQAAAQYG